MSHPCLPRQASMTGPAVNLRIVKMFHWEKIALCGAQYLAAPFVPRNFQVIVFQRTFYESPHQRHSIMILTRSLQHSCSKFVSSDFRKSFQDAYTPKPQESDWQPQSHIQAWQPGIFSTAEWDILNGTTAHSIRWCCIVGAHTNRGEQSYW